MGTVDKWNNENGGHRESVVQWESSNRGLVKSGHSGLVEQWVQRSSGNRGAVGIGDQ